MRVTVYTCHSHRMTLILCVDVLYLIFDYFCHLVVRSLFHVSTMSKGGSEDAGREMFRPHVRSRTVQWPSVPIF